MMSVIVQTAPGIYGVRMIAALPRLLTLLALLLMPFGMVSAPAAAQPMPASHSMAQAEHCDEQPGQDKAPLHSSQQMHCAMCAALPAGDPPAPNAGLQPTAPRIIAVVSPVSGIELEIATPPPKHG